MNSSLIKNSGINLFVLSFMLFSCAKDKVDTGNIVLPINDIKHYAELNGSQVFTDEYAVYHIVKIDSLYILSTPMREPMYRVYDRSHQYIGGFGKTGKGPGEFSDDSVIFQSFSNEESTYAFIYDNRRLTYYIIDVIQSIKSGETILSKTVPAPAILVNSLDAFYAEDQKIVGILDDFRANVFNGKVNWYVYDTKKDSLMTYDILNFESEPLDPVVASNLNIRMISLPPSRYKVAAAMVNAPRLEIFDIANRTEKSINFEKHIQTTFDESEFHEQRITMHFLSNFSTENYIYLLHAGKPEKQIFSNPEVEKQVIILDWEATPVCRFTIPAKYNITTIVADDESRHIYGLSIFNDRIHQFDFSESECFL